MPDASDLRDRMAEMQAAMPKATLSVDQEKQNPAERPGKPKAERQRVPMSVPVQKLEVPPIPGFHLHWFRDEPERIARAQRAGYEFCDPNEVDLNNTDLGGESAASGNTDLGSRVSVISGEETRQDGQPGRLILMKIKSEWWEADQLLVAERNEAVAEAIRGGSVGAGGGKENPRDVSARYTRGTENLFTKKSKR